MPCSCNSILKQALIIAAIGATIGIADSFARPITLTRPPPPPPPSNNDHHTTTSPPTPSTTPNPAYTFATEADLKSKPGQITVAQAKSLFDQQGGGATFIDARKMEEYRKGHVKGSFRMAEADFQFGNPPMLAAISRDATIVVYCNGGNCDESEQVAKLINGSGYQKVYVMHDGIPGWQAMGYPSEEGDGQ